MSAGKLPETDSRMKTLKYCVTQPMLEVPSVAQWDYYGLLIVEILGQ